MTVVLVFVTSARSTRVLATSEGEVIDWRDANAIYQVNLGYLSKQNSVHFWRQKSHLKIVRDILARNLINWNRIHLRISDPDPCLLRSRFLPGKKIVIEATPAAFRSKARIRPMRAACR